ncbi:hypothetical protein [Mucilaginibacter sp.]|uniref:hypothetical protein n=1 Tax=Mucilaginibacter sp. TaxID=1882438 RepID=UPI0026257C75|nr:hypothetical protein [Mucilaginibacter sp.]
MKYIYLFIPFLLVQSIFAQSKLPVIKATSKSVAINDGGYLDKNAWSLSPGIRPDVFTADRTRKTKWVTFYTDIDSIRVKVKPGTKYNFVVLLNGKDSCYTQIASAIPPETPLTGAIAANDTIPFTLTAFNAICVKTVINNTDTLNLHFDISSFDFHLTRDAILKKTKLLSNQPDAFAGKANPDYNKLNKVFRLQMGNAVWTHPEVLPTKITADDMDGRFGPNLFEGKSVEIDYDKNLLIIHSKLPKVLKGYVRSKIGFTHSYAYITGAFEIENKKYFGDFSMDTGSALAIILDSAWVSRQQFPTNLKLIKTSALRDPRGVKYETKLVLSPLLKLNNFDLTNIPTLILSNKNPAGFEINFLGNDLLKRFNMILDFKNDYIYLKPNKLMSLKYRQNS